MRSTEFLEKINVTVMESFPSARLYELQSVCNVVNESDTEYEVEGINVNESKVIYGYVDNDKPYTLIATLENDNIVIKEVDGAWCQDRPFTPYISMDSDDAVKLLGENDYPMPSPAFTLRFPLYPTNEEPIYIFGTSKTGYVSVGVYSGFVEEIN